MPENGNEQFTVYVDPHLMTLLQVLADKNDRSRNKELERAVKTYLAIEMSKDPDFWHKLYRERGLLV